jgi:hypothetical protein
LLYAPLANSWCKIYPGCLNLSETRNINPRSNQGEPSSSMKEINSSNTIRGSYNPPEQTAVLPRPSLQSTLYSSVLQMVGTSRQQEFSSSNSRGGYERLNSEESTRIEEDVEDNRVIRNWNPTSAVASLGLAMKDLANDPFGNNSGNSMGTIPLASPGASNKIYSV